MKESYKCFISYLNDRTQKVKINYNILDNDKTLNFGIPQRSTYTRTSFIHNVYK